ncbi:MAG: hypothetical protein HYS81_05465 [Candidatus Aenigmatarchaeota archaeon]|nr:MAG: hypothetical protein HYS81_05465 [Candidatus Aenigmarchaeota archaeon]
MGRRGNGSKGQFNIEYIVALIIFISIIVFLSIQLAQAVPKFHGDSVTNRLQAQAFRVTDDLIKTPGEPQRWESASAQAFGFAERPYLINATKLAAFNTTCLADYEGTKNTLGLSLQSDFQMRVLVNGTSAIDCGQRRVPLAATQLVVRRTAYTPAGEIVDMTFQVWT